MPPVNVYVTDPKEWEKRRSLITRLYIGEGGTLGEVVEIMAEKYKISCNYKNKFRVWKLRKNRSLRDRTKSIREGGRHLSTGRKEIALWQENTQTNTHNQPTQVPGQPGGFEYDNAAISGINLPDPDHLGTELMFETGPVQDPSEIYLSEPDASTTASAPLWPTDDSNIREQSRINIGVPEYDSLMANKPGMNREPSNTPPPKTSSVEEMEKPELLPANTVFYDASEHHKAVAGFAPQVGMHLTREEWLAREPCLHRSAYFGYEDMVHLILKMNFSMNISSKGSDGGTALHWAVLGGHRGVARLLLEGGIDLSQNYYGETALHLAARFGHEEIARLILNKDIDLSLRDLNGETALHLAARYGREGIACLILNKDIDLSLRDLNGETALEVAKSYKHGYIASLIHWEGTKRDGLDNWIRAQQKNTDSISVPHDNPLDPTNTRINPTLECTTHRAPSNRGPYDVLPPPQYDRALPRFMVVVGKENLTNLHQRAAIEMP